MMLLLWLLSPSAAFAHASLVASDPANDAVLARAPTQLTLTFNEPVEPVNVRIVGVGGVSLVSGIARDGARLVFHPPQTLQDGAYVVSWRVISADGHPVGGALTFFVGNKTTAAPELGDPEGAPVRIAIWLARLLVYAGLFVGVGGAFFAAWMQTQRIQGPASARWPQRAAIAVSVVALIALLLSVGLQGLDAIGLPLSGIASEQVWRTGASGSFGVAAAFAAIALLLALVALRSCGSVARMASLGALAGVGIALASSGHVVTASPRWLMSGAVFLHGVSLAFWIGALLPLLDALRRPGAEATAILLRFSRAIPMAVGALVASGVLLAVVQVAHVDALWTTAYGRVLSIKIALLLVLFALALWNRVALTPRVANGTAQAHRAMRRSIVAELVVIAAILGVVGLWRFTTPPRALPPEGDSFFTHLHTGKLMADVTIAPGQAGPVRISIALRTPDEAPLEAKAVTVTLENAALGIEQMSAEAKLMPDGEWQARMTAPVPGRWTLGLAARVSDFDVIEVEAPVLIK
jgi:copper transport protein